MARKNSVHVRLWHAPYNGGWIWFDKTQWRSIRGGWRVAERNPWKGDSDPILWWCWFGFCGHIVLQSWPWQESPGDASWRKAKAAIEQAKRAEQEADGSEPPK